MVEKYFSPQNEKTSDADTNIIVSYGWCGGMGEAVLGPPEFSGIQFFEELPVFVTDSRIRNFVQNIIQSGDSIPSVPQRIRIKGCIRLVKKTARNESVWGAPLQTFWNAEIERLDQIEFWDGNVTGIIRIPCD
jgi:hypothetical protein